MDSAPLMKSWTRHDSESQADRAADSEAAALVDEDAIEIASTDSLKASSQHEPKDEQDDKVSVASLHRSSWALGLVAGYSTLAIFAWTILCILTYRPITTRHYGSYHDRTSRDNIHSVYARNEAWLRAARVVQGVVAVLTIPLTSAVCSKAAVVFTQRQRKRRDISLRQMVTLADRSWTSLMIYWHLVRGKIRRFGSSLLYIAIFLNILGGIISPLQSVFLKVSTIKTPTGPKVIWGIADTLDMLGGYQLPEDYNLISILTRSAITATASTDPQMRLWTRGQLGCNVTSDPYGVKGPLACRLGSITLDNMTLLADPFVAHLPAQFSTGLVRQYIPRMNSSATRNVISASEYPSDCDSLPGAFSVRYNHDGAFNGTNYAGNWSLSACMPANQTFSPWQATRDRQDISEQLYLKIAVNNNVVRGDKGIGIYRITMNSSLGYFELPNYANGQVAGPLLAKSPWKINCPLRPNGNTTNCPLPGNVQSPFTSNQYRRDVSSARAGLSSSAASLQGTTNKGPLLLIAMAIFGPNSFIENRVQYPETWIQRATATDKERSRAYCLEQEPMMALLTGSSAENTMSEPGLYPGCVRDSTYSADLVNRQIEQWITAFTVGFTSDRIVNAFEAAAFLANELWLVRGIKRPSLSVTSDLGSDTPLPVISLAGIIIISILLAVYLAGLFAMAFYASGKCVWTYELDAFAMMRIGSALSDDVPFRFVKDSDSVSFLDEAPGWVGDGSGGQGDVGHLELGASTPFARERYVYAYKEP